MVSAGWQGSGATDNGRRQHWECLLLTELGRSGPLPLSELGQRLRLEKSWISRAVEGLVKHGWATKEANPRDARSWLVTLTNDGTERVRELNRTLDAHAQQLLLCLAEPDRKAVETSLLLLFKALREDAAATCSLPAPERKKK